MELFVHFGINGADPACLTSHTYDAMMPYVCVHPLAIVFGTAPYDKEITTMPNTWLFSQLWLGSHLPDSLVHRQAPSLHLPDVSLCRLATYLHVHLATLPPEIFIRSCASRTSESPLLCQVLIVGLRSLILS